MSASARSCRPGPLRAAHRFLPVLCPEKGGLYTNIGADVIFHKRLGFGFDAAWRDSQGTYGGTATSPIAPSCSTSTACTSPASARKSALDLMGGIGWQTTRFYGYPATNSCVTLAPATPAATTSWWMPAPVSVTTSGDTFSSAPKCATTTS